MFMNLDFPHPRHVGRVESRKADYFALVASATSRQATSRTISALLAAPHGHPGEMDFLGSRIAFFARSDGKCPAIARGAFWISGSDEDADRPANGELPVNREGSTDSNSIQLDTVKPELQETERGTEL